MQASASIYGRPKTLAVYVSAALRTAPIDEVIDDAIRAFGMYHLRSAVERRDGLARSGSKDVVLLWQSPRTVGTRVTRRSRLSRWGIIGDGRWGRALGKRLYHNGADVMMAGLLPRKRALKGIDYTTLASLLTSCERIVISVPIDALESMLVSAGPHLRGDHRILTTTRGLTPKTHFGVQKPFET